MLYLYYKVFYSFEFTCSEPGKFVRKNSDPYNALIGTVLLHVSGQKVQALIGHKSLYKERWYSVWTYHHLVD